MSLRKKTLIIIAIISLLLIIILYKASEFILLKSFINLEEKDVELNVKRAMERITSEYESLDIVGCDYAPWNETCEFIVNENREYIDINFTDLTFINNKVNLIIFINPSGKIVYGEWFDLDRKKKLPLPEEIKTYIVSKKDNLYPTSELHGENGIIIINNRPILIASWPIVTGDYKGPIRGMLLIGRHINTSLINRFKKELHMEIAVNTLNNTGIDEHIKGSLSGSHNINTKIVDSNYIKGYGILNDFYGQPAVIIEITLKRDIYHNGQTVIYYILLSIIIACLVFTGSILIFLEKSILSRILKISATIRNITKESNITQRLSISGNDELTYHAIEINKMLDVIEESQKELNKAIMSSITSQIAVLDCNGEITFVNSAWEKFKEEINRGKRKRDASDIGKDYTAIWEMETGVSLKEYKDVISGIQNVIEGKSKSFSCEYKIQSPSGKTWLLLNATPLSGKTGGTVITRIDITERKKAQEELLSMEKQLRQAQKLEAIGTLAGGIAHDFNNILSAILGYTELSLLKKGDLKENLAKTMKATKRAIDLVKQILAFSRQNEKEKHIISLKPLIKEVIKLLKATLPSTIEIKEKINVYSDKMLGDPTEIHQILMNLCTNAGYAMKERGGILEIILTEIHVDENTKIGDLITGSYLNLIVKDTGMGIPQNIVDKIFDPFFTTKPQGEGTGLGLSVVHGIIESYGGKIYVESAPGKGTMFTIYLPSVKGGNKKETTGELKPPPMGKGRILCVDDEEDIVYLMTQLLTFSGFEVTGKTNSKEALEIFRNEPEKFDLIITDYTMPHMTGLVLAKEITNIRPHIPVILCTGLNDSISMEEVNSFGIKEILFKPVNVNTLVGTISEIIS